MRRAIKHVIVCGVTAWLALSSANTFAERPARVKALLKQGAKEYRLSNFKAALEAYKEALAIENRPSTILNVAQCHRQLGERERALFYYRLYLTEWDRANPDKASPFLEEVQGHIKQLAAAIESEKRTQQAVAQPMPPRSRAWT